MAGGSEGPRMRYDPAEIERWQDEWERANAFHADVTIQT